MILWMNPISSLRATWARSSRAHPWQVLVLLSEIFGPWRSPNLEIFPEDSQVSVPCSWHFALWHHIWVAWDMYDIHLSHVTNIESCGRASFMSGKWVPRHVHMGPAQRRWKRRVLSVWQVFVGPITTYMAMCCWSFTGNSLHSPLLSSIAWRQLNHLVSKKNRHHDVCSLFFPLFFTNADRIGLAHLYLSVAQQPPPRLLHSF